LVIHKNNCKKEKKKMQKTSIMIAIILGIILSVTPVLASSSGSPSVVITPVPVPFGGTVNFDVTASVSSTSMTPAPAFFPMGSIVVETPNGDLFQLKASGSAASIYLPDAGDSIRLTYPSASWTILANVGSNGPPSITPGTLQWIWIGNVGGGGSPKDPYTNVPGQYAFVIYGTAGAYAMWYFDISTFFVIPELPLGVLMATIASFAAYGILKKNKERQ
jgi:hypothetical protein